MLAEADKDGDGEISLEEVTAIDPDAGEEFREVDGDGNGKVSKAELKAYIKGMLMVDWGVQAGE